MQTLTHRKPGSLVWLVWILACAVGEVAGGVMVGLLLTTTGWYGVILSSRLVGWAIHLAIIGAIIGLALGACQLLVLGRRIQPFWWLLVTVAGMAVGNSVGTIINIHFAFTMGDSIGPEVVRWGLDHAAGGLLNGAILGLAQWLVLRQRVVHAYWWILANAIAWTMGVVVVRTLYVNVTFAETASIMKLLGAGLFHILEEASYLVLDIWAPEGLSIAGAVVGMSTGIVLIRLFGRDRDNAQ